MSKIFAKTGDLKINGVYLVNKDDKPVSNVEFVAAQKKAERYVTYAEISKTMDFKGKTANTIADLEKKVEEALSNKKVSYVTIPKLTLGKLHEQLKKEVLDYDKDYDKVTKAHKVEDLLQEFNIIKKFETVGLYFEEDVVELTKIYTIEEITKAVEIIVDLV